MRIIRFSKLFVPTAIISVILVIAGIAGYVIKGVNLGVDFQAGLIQEVQFAPSAFGVTYSGPGAAAISFSSTRLDIVITGVGVEGRTATFPFSEYRTAASLVQALPAQVEGIGTTAAAQSDINSQWLIQSAQGNPQLGSEPFIVHYLDPASASIPIEDVRVALTSLGRTVSVQQLGEDADRHFMIRLEDSEIEGDEVPAKKIIDTLESVFGSGGVVVIRSDYVGSRFSENLSRQAAVLLVLTLGLILIYASIRFKPQFAIGAVLAILHDALIIVAFVVWTRMEFNTTTIAAILTILGYSINDTIVIFDRIRETR
ncbi:MAG: protein translocase subunit SecF, partial [Treponema sp.]|nr:protein translocase subunit SecF [Treponema sp.]